MELRETWKDRRQQKHPLAIRWRGQEDKLLDANNLDLGRRALALLRGSSGVKRVWTEEAYQVGPRVPAVIDEELREGADGPVQLNRVEYFGDIAS